MSLSPVPIHFIINRCLQINPRKEGAIHTCVLCVQNAKCHPAKLQPITPPPPPSPDLAPQTSLAVFNSIFQKSIYLEIQRCFCQVIAFKDTAALTDHRLPIFRIYICLAVPCSIWHTARLAQSISLGRLGFLGLQFGLRVEQPCEGEEEERCDYEHGKDLERIFGGPNLRHSLLII